MKRKQLCIILAVAIFTALFAGCGNTGSEKGSDSLPAAPVTLRVAGGWEDCRAIEEIGREFTAEYPNCTIVYEYLQDYYVSLEKRMSGEDAVDLFFVNNIQSDSPLINYAYDLKSNDAIDLSNTFEGLIKNFSYIENGIRSDKLYSIPLGAEMRGLYINKTLLTKLGIEIPKNRETLLKACEVLKENGYIPFHANPGDFSQLLLYPWICNIIANAEDSDEAYNIVNSRKKGVSEMFREPLEFLYLLVENKYYDYKRAQTELNIFTETTAEDYARYFFNIVQKDGSFEKEDDIGKVAFMPSPMSMQSVIDKTKDDYHSKIEYVFVPAPVGKDGAFAYLSPAHGIAVNKGSQKLDWSVKFLNFLFESKNNKRFAENFHIIPNTKQAFNYISSLYSVPDNRISELGQVTFDYDFYNIITASLLEISKANNPKYMKTADDGTVSLYPLEYYLNNLEENLTKDE